MTDQKPIDKTKAQNRKILFSCVFVVGAMVGLAYASVPLYKLFCQVQFLY